MTTYLEEAARRSARELVEGQTIEFRIRADNRDMTVRLDEDELHATRESIALYFWAQHL